MSMMSATVYSPPTATITSDASGNWGCGAFSNTGNWFQLSCKGVTASHSQYIGIWGNQWRGSPILCKRDNAVVVATIMSGTSKDKLVMELIRNIFFILAQFNLFQVSEHLPGVHNGAADALSRNNVSSFRSQVPWAMSQPSVIPEELLQRLVHQLPDWMSENWITLWPKFFLKV